jgi:hypothetical protein
MSDDPPEDGNLLPPEPPQQPARPTPLMPRPEPAPEPETRDIRPPLVDNKNEFYPPRVSLPYRVEEVVDDPRVRQRIVEQWHRSGGQHQGGKLKEQRARAYAPYLRQFEGLRDKVDPRRAFDDTLAAMLKDGFVDPQTHKFPKSLRTLRKRFGVGK